MLNMRYPKIIIYFYDKWNRIYTKTCHINRSLPALFAHVCDANMLEMN